MESESTIDEMRLHTTSQIDKNSIEFPNRLETHWKWKRLFDNRTFGQNTSNYQWTSGKKYAH